MQFHQLKRRELMALLASMAAVPWPIGAGAQLTKQTKQVGLLSGFSQAELKPLADEFRRRMGELGWVEGNNLKIDVRSAAGDYKRLSEDAGELVAAKMDVIVAMGTPGVTAVQQHSRTIPVVFTLVADPVSQGFIKNLAHPGGNLTASRILSS